MLEFGGQLPRITMQEKIFLGQLLNGGGKEVCTVSWLYLKPLLLGGGGLLDMDKKYPKMQFHNFKFLKEQQLNNSHTKS